jgi:methylenetetrahydrofolate reductase (NADPH)
MPITSLKQVQRFAELSGAAIPREVLDELTPFADDQAAVRAAGVALATRMCDRLLAEGAPGLHYYTLNRSTATREIHAQLGVAAQAAGLSGRAERRAERVASGLTVSAVRLICQRGSNR